MDSCRPGLLWILSLIWWKGFPTPIARTMITYWQPTLCLFRSLALFKRAVITIIPPPFDYPTVSKGLLTMKASGTKSPLAFDTMSPIQCKMYSASSSPFHVWHLGFHGKARNCCRSALQAATLNANYWNGRPLKSKHFFSHLVLQSDVIIYAGKTWCKALLVFLLCYLSILRNF